MLVELDKDQVAQHFGRAAQHYDQHAFIQRDIGEQLSSLIPVRYYESCLDIGCGTGASLPELAGHSALVTAFDLSHQMLETARNQISSERDSTTQQQPDFQWVQGDLDAMPFGTNSFDLVHSNLALQWASNLGTVIEQIGKLLKPDGVFVFSCIVEGTLFELEQSWAAIDQQRHINRFVKSSDLQQSLASAGFTCGEVFEKQQRWYYPSLGLMLKDMKAIGANYVPERQTSGLMTPSQWRALQCHYQQKFGCEAGLPVTYQVLYGALKRG
ncbi:malonyl-[acyl-carrier protein] O-methyltransferase BioC [Alginatibacterium sediminis]|uniref:Malonyl-[acyl-carrier protein] O-methyltransferase n=1 Tax=Alginatibacterium sediminis TaxID=2164068 RepID=A0A420EIB0_9ALTE|nr:malonyl-ACP O-methyltransferase BioC [Alginatibacterium sediminis]RKF20420.1 malonyl-[acyl-carrier protein] O-methyltransferase BioC [Alginatibacterium sediminis]